MMARLLHALCLLAWVPSTKALIAAIGTRSVPDARFAALTQPQRITPDIPVAGSTAAQDQGRCPLLQLSSEISMTPGYIEWSGQQGTWKMHNGIVLGSWRQNYYTEDYDDVRFSNLDQQLAVKAIRTSDEQLHREFGWRARQSVADFPALQKLEDGYDAAASADGREDELAKAGIVPPLNATNATYRLVDCDEKLLFVVKLEAEQLRPGGINIYDQSGALVAHSLAGHESARIAFVDPNAYLLATAEAPALGANISLPDIPRVAATGGILPYQVRFEGSDYTNSSRLLDVHYRWALVSALQLHAIHDAQGAGIDQPPILAVISVTYWTLAALGLLIVGYMCFLVYRGLFPPTHGGYSVDAFVKKV